LPISILTDFEETAIYDCRLRPKPNDKPSIGRVRFYTYTQYLDSFEEIYNLLSKESVLKGSFDKFAESDRQKRGTTEVDAEFLKEIESWREALAKDIALKNPKLSIQELNFAVQLTIDRIIFLRMCEDRGIEPYGQIQSLFNGTNTYRRLKEIFYHADDKYNSGLFDFKTDRLTPEIKVDDKPLKDIFKTLYYPESPYEFSVLGADILGHVYEQFLGKVIRLTEGHRAKVEEKPEVRKAGGVYYTPTYIVEYIVKNTVGKICEGKTPKQISSLRILDPACGSGSFLLGAYQYLLDYHRDWYIAHTSKNKNVAQGFSPAPKEIYQGHGGHWYLTTQEKKRILLNNIYGVDIDPQAVEVTKLSLLLKVLEGENQDTLERQMKLFKERALPDLGSNIKCGNSLIGPDFYQGKQMNFLDPEDAYRINVFDWEKEFPEIMKRGGFNAVIGNPPYIRIQTMKEWAPVEVEIYKKYYAAASKGNYDIYVVFVERGLRLLNKSGRLGFILPHKFFNAQYGEALRTLLSEGKHLAGVVHFGDKQVFAGATNYTCLLFLDKTGSKQCHFIKVDDLTDWRINGEAAEGKIPATKITSSEWNFTVGKGAELFEKLSKMPVKLKDVAERIFQGIIPGADNVYTIELLTKDKKEALCYSRALDAEVYLEPALLRKIVSGAEVGRFTLAETSARVIYPYITYDNESVLVTPTKLDQDYPLTFKYFQKTRELLDKRDRGSAKGIDWYKYIRRQNISLQSLRKLAVPRLVPRLQAGYDEDGSFCLDNVDVGGIILPDSCPLFYEYILGLLNSKLLNFCFIRNTVPFRGGFFSANRQYIEKLPIRTINFSDPGDKARHAQMVGLVEQMLSLHKQLAEARTPDEKTRIQRQIDATDQQIDGLVYELYGLTENEIQIVEEKTK
ncbi:MAG: N-6 DNA methylase, partial [Thermodesulfobacteriota bacterium]